MLDGAIFAPLRMREEKVKIGLKRFDWEITERRPELRLEIAVRLAARRNQGSESRIHYLQCFPSVLLIAAAYDPSPVAPDCPGWPTAWK